MINFPASTVPLIRAWGAAPQQTVIRKADAAGHLFVPRRFSRHQAFGAYIDQEDLDEARKWHASGAKESLPKGHTTYARSRGPGGQHVNKTESKAITVWPVKDLMKGLPKLMHAALRSSRYYTAKNDSISIHAQTQRNRTANTEENHHKLYKELQRIFHDTVPGETSAKTAKKYEALEKVFHAKRLDTKKHHSSKKAFRRSSGE